MKWSQSHVFTLKEAPGDAEILSHKLIARAGLVRKLAPGIYTYGPLMLRAIRKFEKIIREELDLRGCIEILMPMVQPQSIWEETGRWKEMGDGLLKFKNRNDQPFCLGATHEEAVVDFFRQDLRSFRDLPKNFYQIQTKYRDEIRPRFGLMRGREFIMKDAYSFDISRDEALKTYEKMYAAYCAIFNRLGLKYRIVQADAGNIGGSQTHEFQLLAEAGEDALLVSETSDFAANVEVCPALDFEPSPALSGRQLPIEKFPTPGLKTIADLAQSLKVSSRELVKTLFFSSSDGKTLSDKKPICVVVRGSDEANPIKIKNLLGLDLVPFLLEDREVKELTGASPGSCGPVGLKVPVYMDNGVATLENFVTGANEDGFHLRNVNVARDFKVEKTGDFRFAVAGDKDPLSNGRLHSYRGIEVGHVFYLGTKYSQKMHLQFQDQNGQSKEVEMGCYGIGVSRTVQASLEQSHDADGIIWPPSIAPYTVHICVLDPQDPQVIEVADQIEKICHDNGWDFFADDRDERPGVKFKDADLLGFPIRIVLGKKGLQTGIVEIVNRKTKEQMKLNLANMSLELPTTIQKFLGS